MRIITDKAEIEAAQNKFEEKLKSVSSQNIPVNKIITPGGITDDVEVFYSKEFDMWFHFNIAGKGTRYWNVFGLGRPKENGNIFIKCEINFPVKDKNLRIGGIITKDDSENFLIYHTGRINGGKGMTKKFFFDKYKGEIIQNLPETKHLSEPRVAVIGNLNSHEFVKNVKNLVSEVDRIKSLVR